MARLRRYKIIRFVTTDGGPAATITLKLTGDMLLTAGVQPNVHTFDARWPEVEPIQDDPGRMGTIEFWSTGTPDQGGAPDLELKRMRIVDIETVTFGFIKGRPGRGPVVVRLHIADRRELFTWPRGGILQLGEFNKDPLSRDGTKDANGRTTVSCRKLVEMCLTEMRIIEEVTVPHALSDTVAPRNIAWNGAPAPAELEKLLKDAGFVFWVKSDGNFEIAQINSGPAPTLPASAVEWPCLGIDRRGQTVILTSHPFPIVETLTLNAPANYPETAESDDLEYVGWQDQPSRWVPIAQMTADPVDAVRKRIAPANLTTFETLSLFRCVRLNQAKWGKRGILRKLIGEDKPLPFASAVNVVLAMDGTYQNKTTQLNPDHISDDGNVLVFNQLLGKLADGHNPGPDPFTWFVPLRGDELKLTVTAECTKKNDAGEDVPEYFFVGFEWKLGGTLRKLENAELKALMSKPGAVIIARPELRLLRKDGEDQNLRQVEDLAAVIAAGLLRRSDEAAKEYKIRGFAKVELGPRIGEIKISQNGPNMMVRTNAWHFPHARAYTASGAKPTPKAATERFVNETQTASVRTSLGASSATQPSVPVLPGSPPAPPEDRLVLVDLEKVSGSNGTKTTAATWKYKVSRKGIKLLDETGPVWSRQNGTFAFATQGIAQITIDGTVTLLFAFEVRGTVGCS